MDTLRGLFHWSLQIFFNKENLTEKLPDNLLYENSITESQFDCSLNPGNNFVTLIRPHLE